MKAPTIPTTMLPRRPKPPPLTMSPANQPAIAPTMMKTIRLSYAHMLIPSFWEVEVYSRR